MKRSIHWALLFAMSPVMAQAHGPMHIVALHPGGAVTSGNWSGYAVTGLAGSVTAVSGSWVVPEAECDDARHRNTGASFWVGIDGYKSPTVEQTGTDSDCTKGRGRYYAWYEFFPRRGITIKSMPVNAGDTMSASVTYDGSKFTATIADVTQNTRFSVSRAVSKARRNSAEWIAEDNSRVFTEFRDVQFGQDATSVANTCTATVDGTTGAIGDFATDHAIDMVEKNGRLLALPSPLSADNTSFEVQRP
ncbi:MAG TPA: G1 family glutamic endopeptidase [Rhizomicrobium sp.]|jgi:hypothetical protein